jgi:NAD(P)-dependent dehydrogenase (short-subunit alcohol dehydrogenase family)
MSDESARPHALIIGASSGLGAACAERFSHHYNVTGISRRGTLPPSISSKVGFGVACDATSADALKTCIEEAVGKFGKISVMIVSAGLQLIKPVRNVKEQEALNLLEANIAAPFFAASLFSSQRISNPNAVLCLVSSISSIRSEPGIVLYGATKAATNSLVAGLARELAPRRVVGVSPGWLDTPMTQAYSHVYNADFLEKLKSRTPLGVVATEDIVNSIEFLLSPGAKKITGQVLVVDGGASL